MEELYGGECTFHMNGGVLTKQIQSLGYYWSMIEVDCLEFIQKYQKIMSIYSIDPLFSHHTYFPMAILLCEGLI